MTAARVLPSRSMALRMANSLTKAPKGGEPAMDRNSAIQSTPVAGRARSTPRTS